MLIADEAFSAAVAGLRSARMGTELMGPLLYSLVRSTRAERVVEIGSGLTTLYLARALADNQDDVERESAQLRAKQQAHAADWADGPPDERTVLGWLEADPPLADPGFYERGYRPSCATVDDGSSPFSAAGRVFAALDSARLGHLVQRYDTDFRAAAGQFADSGRTFDLAWFDCGGAREYRDFLDRYWPLVDPDGGMVVLHYTLTVPSHEAVVEEFARDGRDGRYGRFELMSLREPHKMMQNSCTLIRRCDVPQPDYPLTRPVSLERSPS